MRRFFKDQLIIAFSFAFSLWFFWDALFPIENYLIFAALFLCAWPIVSWNFYHSLDMSTNVSLRRELAHLLFVWFLLLLIASLVLFVLKMGEGFSRAWVLSSVSISLLGMILARVFRLFSILNGKGSERIVKSVAIIGYDQLGRDLCEKLIENPWAGVRPFAVFDDIEFDASTEYEDLPIFSKWQEFDSNIREKKIENSRKGLEFPEIWITLPIDRSESIEFVYGRKDMFNDFVVRLVPNLNVFDLTSYKADSVLGFPVLSFFSKKARHKQELIKRIQDVLLSSLLLVVLSPFFLLIAILIKLDSVGPVLYKQKRYGLECKEFYILKFRTMKASDSDTSVKQAEKEDSRVTFVGRFLRRHSFDELPQLFNTLIGEMSLVGPRPHAVAHNEFYKDRISDYMARHKVKPGITGWAQVNGYRGETPQLQDMERRVMYDLEYIENRSTLADFRILIRTFFLVFRDPNAY